MALTRTGGAGGRPGHRGGGGRGPGRQGGGAGRRPGHGALVTGTGRWYEGVFTPRSSPHAVDNDGITMSDAGYARRAVHNRRVTWSALTVSARMRSVSRAVITALA